MTNVFNLAKIKEIFEDEQEAFEDFLYELKWQSAGSRIDFENTELPSGWVFTIVESNTDIDYDSYGYGSAPEANVIFSVTDGEDTAYYKLPGEYVSYEGWAWEVNNIREVRQGTKTVTFWKEVN